MKFSKIFLCVASVIALMIGNSQAGPIDASELTAIPITKTELKEISALKVRKYQSDLNKSEECKTILLFFFFQEKGWCFLICAF